MVGNAYQKVTVLLEETGVGRVFRVFSKFSFRIALGVSFLIAELLVFVGPNINSSHLQHLLYVAPFEVCKKHLNSFFEILLTSYQHAQMVVCVLLFGTMCSMYWTPALIVGVISCIK